MYGAGTQALQCLQVLGCAVALVLSQAVDEAFLRDAQFRQTYIVYEEIIRLRRELLHSVAHRQPGSGGDACFIDDLMGNHAHPESHSTLNNAVINGLTLPGGKLLAMSD